MLTLAQTKSTGSSCLRYEARRPLNWVQTSRWVKVTVWHVPGIEGRMVAYMHSLTVDPAMISVHSIPVLCSRVA